MSQLFHYTSAAGLDGIIRSNSIWASDYRFLNDSSEFHHGAKLFDRVLDVHRQNLASLGSGRVLSCVDMMRDALFSPESNYRKNICIFVASFSEEPDLLSQWRGYNSGRGFSVGLNAQWISQNADAQGFRLSPVVYEIDEQLKALDDNFRWLIKLTDEKYMDGDFLKTVDVWWERVLWIISVLKDPNFREEKEHRVVKVLKSWPRDVLTRSTMSGLIPYIRCHFDIVKAMNILNSPQNLGFESIVVGPALHNRQAAAVDALLSSKHMRFPVTKSVIPFVAE